MWNKPSPEELNKLPSLYETEGVDLKDKMIHQHYFLGNCDWFMAEYSPKDRLFFGFANLGDPQNAEWGYISLDELAGININGIEVDRDLYWKPKRFGEIDNIRRKY